MINEGRSFSKKVAAYFFRRVFRGEDFPVALGHARCRSRWHLRRVSGDHNIHLATTQPELGGAMSTTWLADAQGLRWPGLWLYEHGSAERLFHSLKTALDQERFESVEGGGRDG
ncbi:MAG: hypothetical protein VYA34_17290 [Myxococcota bacterium]|nr:hypothetical protein [Myxococcota bacterium]